MMDTPCQGGRRIVLTGGPGGGKTTAADLMRREVGDQIVVVPEAATMLFSGGFPRHADTLPRESAQLAIYHVQRQLEDVHSSMYPERTLLCDRGTLDGAVYWPLASKHDFLGSLQSSTEQELARYDAVIFFETAAVGNLSIEGGNPIRTESLEEAIRLDRRLQEIWNQHPHFHFVPHQQSFLKKLQMSIATLRQLC
jgi:predicted ATPase